MIRKSAFSLFIVMILLMSAAGPTSSHAASLAVIEDVTVSEDLKKVVVKFNRRAIPPTVFKIDGPPRLVMDFEGVALGKAPKQIPFENQPLKEVRAGKLPMGSRIVVDFGDYVIPQYKVRRMDNYFIVLFGEFTQESEVSYNQPAGQGVPVMPAGYGPSQESDANIINDERSNLVIQSAEVKDESILLEVTLRDNPDKTYKIRLGVDFEQLGFNTANIRCAPGVKKSKKKKTLLVEAARKSLRMAARNTAAGPRRGPVKKGAVKKAPANPASIITRCSFKPQSTD
jgi:hypothetical protein